MWLSWILLVICYLFFLLRKSDTLSERKEYFKNLTQEICELVNIKTPKIRFTKTQKEKGELAHITITDIYGVQNNTQRAVISIDEITLMNLNKEKLRGVIIHEITHLILPPERTGENYLFGNHSNKFERAMDRIEQKYRRSKKMIKELEK